MLVVEPASTEEFVRLLHNIVITLTNEMKLHAIGLRHTAILLMGESAVNQIQSTQENTSLLYIK